MPVIDRLRRTGLDGRSVITGPSQLKPRKARGTRNGLGSRFGLTDVYDEYEIGSGSSGTLAGTYVITVRPYSQSGLRARTRAIGQVILCTRVNGIAVPTGPITLLSRRKPSSSESVLTLPSRVAALGDQLWVLVELLDASPARYQLDVDFTAA
jgi:hypothetical protein